ncbi:MAG: hypothetical protein ACOYXT_02110 [Bacteroidota bacterium]
MKTWMVRPCTARQLAELYEVTYRIFKGHLKKIESKVGTRVGHYFTVNQVIIIIEELGPFPNVEIIYPRKIY